MTVNELLSDAWSVLPSVLVATALGVVFTLHPTRLRRLRQTKKGRELLKGQVLMSMAGSLMILVIGEGQHSSARAFGLLGLGSLIRFRTNIKSPADTAIFFVLIGLGMACSVGRMGAAIASLLFLLVVVTVLEALSPGPKTPTTDEDDEDD